MGNPDGTSDQAWNTTDSTIPTSLKQECKEYLTQWGSPPKNRMPKISCTDATIHAAQDFINELQNPSPAIPLVTFGNKHNEALITPDRIFEKLTSSARSLRVVHPEQHQPII